MLTLISPRALAHAIFPNAWPSFLKCWNHFARSSESKRSSSTYETTPGHTHLNPVLPYQFNPLPLDLPSPTLILDSTLDSEYLTESQLELSNVEERSQYSMPNVEGDHSCLRPAFRCLPEAISSSPKDLPRQGATVSLSIATFTDASMPPECSRDSILANYSQQELVLLEFLTHAAKVEPRDIDKILLKHPPGFSATCYCASPNEENDELCEICQLVDAYMDFSLERFQESDIFTEIA